MASASAKLNRKVRGMAVGKISSRPVLPHAAQFIADTGLQYEYGQGINPNPSYGMIPR